jgi:hypothetical protein
LDSTLPAARAPSAAAAEIVVIAGIAIIPIAVSAGSAAVKPPIPRIVTIDEFISLAFEFPAIVSALIPGRGRDCGRHEQDSQKQKCGTTPELRLAMERHRFSFPK